MIFEDKPITLKDGRTAILKSPCVEDAEKLLNYIKTSCGETEYLARYPEEWNTTVEQEEAWVNRLRSSPDTLGITCYVDGEVAGNCEISFRGGMKTSHRATSLLLFSKTTGISESVPQCLRSLLLQHRIEELRSWSWSSSRAMIVQGTYTRNSVFVWFPKSPMRSSSRTARIGTSFICRSICKKNDFVGKTTPNKAACRNWSVPTGGFILAIDRFILRDRFQILFQISVEYQISVLQRHIVNQIVKL